MNILYVASRFPYPPLKGDRVRAYHQLRMLARTHAITLVSFADTTANADDLARVAGLCERVVTVPLTPAAMAGAVARTAGTALPLQTMLFQTAAMRRAVTTELARGIHDVAVAQLARMVPHLVPAPIPLHVDLIDALSLNMRRRAALQPLPLRAAFTHEADRMLRYERRICERVDGASVVSALDRAAIGPYETLAVNPNGVDLDAFSYLRSGRRQRTIVFSGNMSYFPNVDAVSWFAREVFPRVRALVPDALLEIVGTDPTPAVRALAAADPSITVTGRVADLHEHLARATIGVVPMRSGTGMQNKVIEAMASGTPLVVSSFALGGLALRNERHVLIADDAFAFAAATIRLLEEPALRETLAHGSRRLVEQRYGWGTSVAVLEDLLGAAVERHRRRSTPLTEAGAATPAARARTRTSSPGRPTPRVGGRR